MAFLLSQRNGDDIFFVESVDCFYSWIDGKYVRPVKPDHLKKKIWWFLSTEFAEQGISENQVGDIYRQLRYACEVTMESVNDGYIAFDDCLLNVETFEPEPFGKEKYASFFLPYRYSDLKDAPAPHFHRFLETTLVREDEKCCDTELVDVMQELFGYCLLPTLDAAAAFFFVGEGANGKSVMANLLSTLAGSEYVSSLSIEALTTRQFYVAELVGKKLNICNEEESKFMKSDKFKALISGDPVSAERKFGGVFRFIPKAKYVFCSNLMPTFDGINFGLLRRIKVVPFFQTFTNGSKDRKLFEKLRGELPGVVWWALRGAKRLASQEFEFSRSSAMDAKLVEFENEISSALMFFREEFLPEPDGETVTMENDVLYKEYATWCEENGRKAMNSNNFFKELSKKYGGTTFIWKDGRSVRAREVRATHIRRTSIL